MVWLLLGKVSEKESYEEKEDYGELGTIFKEISETFDSHFREVGFIWSERMMYKVRGNWVCTANCAALHYHQAATRGEEILDQRLKI